MDFNYVFFQAISHVGAPYIKKWGIFVTLGYTPCWIIMIWPASQSKAVKTQMIAWFPEKTWAKKITRWVGTQGLVKLAKKAKTCPHYDVTHRQPQIQNVKFFKI